MLPPEVLSSLGLQTMGSNSSAAVGTGSVVVGTEEPTTGSVAANKGTPTPPGGEKVEPLGPEQSKKKGDETKILPFILGKGIASVPARLVAHQWKGEFVDMADLLCDNTVAERRWNSSLGGHMQLGQPKVQQREVPDVLSWAQRFSVFIGVVVEKQPHRVWQLLAYQATILREARRCGGAGWRSYDAMFHQLAAANETIN